MPVVSLLVTTVLAVGVTAVVAANVAQILAPLSPLRRSGRHSKLDPPPGSTDAPAEALDGVGGWVRWWMRCPRPAIRFGDWVPHHGFLFLPTLIGIGLSGGGLAVLVGPDQTFRLGGLLAVLGGIPLLTIVVLYVLRPAKGRVPGLEP
jgi:hypothetical protein